VISENLVKGGENVIRISLLRTAKGVRLSAKAHEVIESFFKAQTGETYDVREFGLSWQSDKTLQVWHIASNEGGVKEGPRAYYFNHPGGPLMSKDGERLSATPIDAINLSFLRLKGISEDSGVSFDVRGAFSLPYLQKLAERIVLASQQFYIDYLKPVDITVTVNTQETRF
jgi:hypothetical protein